MKQFFRAVIIAFCGMVVAVAAYAQGTTSRVTGVIADKAGAVIPGATVTLTNEGTNVSFTTQSTDSGTYVFEAIQVGSYTITVELNGFKKYVAKNNVLTIGVPLTVNIAMEVGATAEQVEVVGQFEKVQTSTSGNLGSIVDNKTLVDLPLGLEAGTGGRNPLLFLRLQPGVSVGANTGGATHVNGARDRAQNQTLDGIDINETSAGGSDFAPIRTNPDSIQEFRAITSNASAEFGRGSGAQVALVSKSGTNNFHGNLFYFNRSSALSANEWENNFNKIAKPFLLQNQYGGSIGGPILKDRTFFFFNFQGQRQKQQRTVTRTVYTATAKQGIFRYRVGGQNGPAGSSTAVVDNSGNPIFPTCSATVTTNCIASYNIATNDPRRLGLDSSLTSWYALQPAPNSFSAGGDGLNTAAYIFNVPIRNPQEDYTFKIDHKFNDLNTVFFRYSWGRQDTPDDIGNGGEPRFPGQPGTVDTLRKPLNWAANYRRVLNNTMVNELVVGANLFTFSFFNPVVNKQPLTWVTNNTTDPVSYFGEGNARVLSTYQVVDNFSWTKNQHLIKAGVNLRYQIHEDQRGSIASQNAFPSANFSRTVTVVNTACASGTFGSTGTTGVVSGQERFCLPGTATTSPLYINANDQARLQSMVNDMLGRVGTVSQGFVAAPDGVSYLPGGNLFLNDARYPEYDWYMQDTWKARRNLTIDFGLRWEGRLTPFARNRLFTPNQRVSAGATPSNTLRWIDNDLYDSDLNNWSPTVGFAWDPKGDGKTSIRANYRLAYDRINTFVISSQIYNTIPGITFGSANSTFGPSGGPGGVAGRLRDGVPTLSPPAGISPQALTQPAPLGAAGSAITVLDPDFRSPKTNMWSLNVQRDFGKGILVDVAYIGRRASGLFGAYNVNQIDIFNSNLNGENFLTAFNTVKAGGASPLMDRLYGPDTRKNTGETGSAFVRRQFANDIALNSVAIVARDAARRVQSGRSLLDLAGLSPFFFRRFPQFENVNVIDSNDFSTYHALQVMVQRKFTKNLTFQGSYTFSKSLDSRSYDPAFTVVSGGTNQSASSTPFNINNRRLNYARSDFDQTHFFVGYGIWDLPFGQGQRFLTNAPPVIRQIVEGWNINGVLTLTSGRPFTVYSGSNQISDVNSVPANCNGCSPKMGKVDLTSSTFNGFVGYFTAEQLARFSQPAPGTVGNVGRNFFDGPNRFNVDAAFLKRTPIREGMNFELRFEFFNLTNSPTFSFPTATITSATFGRIGATVISESRKVRIGAKLNF
ncbi:MAG: carboxypeptidase regulatory-like domain-containing protein [Blastocatellia bacterium]|nr:carboxypeptidase regulatory-like domain-containing protein [Blastocatellia bacterium]